MGIRLSEWRNEKVNARMCWRDRKRDRDNSTVVETCDGRKDEGNQRVNEDKCVRACVCVRVCACVWICLYVCVKEREREKRRVQLVYLCTTSCVAIYAWVMQLSRIIARSVSRTEKKKDRRGRGTTISRNRMYRYISNIFKAMTL